MENVTHYLHFAENPIRFNPVVTKKFFLLVFLLHINNIYFGVFTSKIDWKYQM